MPSNNFGVRWSVTRDFGSGGPFTFTASALDGMRVYVDGVRKIDVWKNVSATVKKTVNVTIPAGKHTIRFDFVNWTGSANVRFAYAPRTSAAYDKVKPLIPTGTAVSYNSVTGAAKLTWTRSKEMDLANYRVYRRLKGAPYGKQLATTTATSYTDSALPKTGATYYYEVRAVDKAGNVSGGSPDKLVTTVDRTPPAAPFVEQDACPADQPYAAPQLVTTRRTPPTSSGTRCSGSTPPRSSGAPSTPAPRVRSATPVTGPTAARSPTGGGPGTPPGTGRRTRPPRRSPLPT
ncbi:PA14 domain-containing protein [Streptomyces sp. SGAir0957]